MTTLMDSDAHMGMEWNGNEDATNCTDDTRDKERRMDGWYVNRAEAAVMDGMDS